METPEETRVHQKLASLHAALSALWMPVKGKKLDPATAAAIAENAIEELEGIIQDARANIERSRDFSQIAFNIVQKATGAKPRQSAQRHSRSGRGR